MMHRIRQFLLLEFITFVFAALIHFGAFLSGYEHLKAGVAESVIAVVLSISWTMTWIVPRWTRRVGLAGQAFALLGVLVGVATIAIGVGPRTMPDIAYHLAIAAVLVWGLVVAKRTPSDASPSHDSLVG